MPLTQTHIAKLLFTDTTDFIALTAFVEDLAVGTPPPLPEVKTVTLLAGPALVTLQPALPTKSVVAVVALWHPLLEINYTVTTTHRTHPFLGIFELRIGIQYFPVSGLVLLGQSLEGRMGTAYFFSTVLVWTFQFLSDFYLVEKIVMETFFTVIVPTVLQLHDFLGGTGLLTNLADVDSILLLNQVVEVVHLSLVVCTRITDYVALYSRRDPQSTDH